MQATKKHLVALMNIVGENGFIEDKTEQEPFVTDWRGRTKGVTPIVLLPSSTEQVVEIVKFANEHKLKLTPQGGNTGLVLGGIPSANGDEIVINLSRMNKIISLDKNAYTISCEAGAILQNVQKAADDENRLFPLSLASEGSCQIGGNIATNAGGIHVLKYGNMRDQVLGLEVVLPSGEVWNGLKSLRKDNSGYDLKQLFIGSEGTLGIITKATLKIVPKPNSIETAMIGFNNAKDAVQLLSQLRSTLGDGLVAFEIFPHQGLEIVIKNIEGSHSPMEKPANWYAVCEIWGFEEQEQLSNRFRESLLKSCDSGLAEDIVIASNERQRKNFWDLRESFAPALKKEGAGFAFDLSISTSDIPNFLKAADSALEKHLSGIKTIAFGHAGDGNMHYNIAPPKGMSTGELLEKREGIIRIVHDLVQQFSGSIAAEHGVGTQKANEMLRYKSESEISTFRSLKKALDPKGIMNNGRILP